MVNYTEFMSIGLNSCGSDPETFSGLTDIWSRNKDEIQSMSKSEVRNDLVCP